MAYEFHQPHRIEFAETDLAGMVHFSNYFRYMEMAEHAFFRMLGLSVHAPVEGRVISWPRVRAECTFQSPLQFEDQVVIHLLVRAKSKRSITYEFQFLKDGQRVARGTITAACVALDTDLKQITSIPIPAAIDQKIETAPAEILRNATDARASS